MAVANLWANNLKPCHPRKSRPFCVWHCSVQKAFWTIKSSYLVTEWKIRSFITDVRSGLTDMNKDPLWHVCSIPSDMTHTHMRSWIAGAIGTPHRPCLAPGKVIVVHSRFQTLLWHHSPNHTTNWHGHCFQPLAPPDSWPSLTSLLPGYCYLLPHVHDYPESWLECRKTWAH